MSTGNSVPPHPKSYDSLCIEAIALPADVKFFGPAKGC
jgi:hypothetical protein